MTGVEAEDSTVRHISASGRQAFRARRKPPLNEERAAKRLAWATANQHWGKHRWREVLFADEKYFQTPTNHMIGSQTKWIIHRWQHILLQHSAVVRSNMFSTYVSAVVKTESAKSG